MRARDIRRGYMAGWFVGVAGVVASLGITDGDK